MNTRKHGNNEQLLIKKASFLLLVNFSSRLYYIDIIANQLLRSKLIKGKWDCLHLNVTVKIRHSKLSTNLTLVQLSLV